MKFEKNFILSQNKMSYGKYVNLCSEKELKEIATIIFTKRNYAEAFIAMQNFILSQNKMSYGKYVDLCSEKELKEIATIISTKRNYAEAFIAMQNDCWKSYEDQDAFLKVFMDGSFRSEVVKERRAQREAVKVKLHREIKRDFKENRLSSTNIEIEDDVIPVLQKDKRRMFIVDGQQRTHELNRCDTYSNGVLEVVKDGGNFGYTDMVTGKEMPRGMRPHEFVRFKGEYERLGDLICFTGGNKIDIWDTKQNRFSSLYTNSDDTVIFNREGQLLAQNIERIVTINKDFYFTCEDDEFKGKVVTVYSVGDKIYETFSLKNVIYPRKCMVFENGKLWYETKGRSKRVRVEYDLKEYAKKRVLLIDSLLPVKELQEHIVSYLTPF